jgi:hypothetical protein
MKFPCQCQVWQASLFIQRNHLAACNRETIPV